MFACVRIWHTTTNFNQISSFVFFFKRRGIITYLRMFALEDGLKSLGI